MVFINGMPLDDVNDVSMFYGTYSLEYEIFEEVINDDFLGTED